MTKLTSLQHGKEYFFFESNTSSSSSSSISSNAKRLQALHLYSAQRKATDSSCHEEYKPGPEIRLPTCQLHCPKDYAASWSIQLHLFLLWPDFCCSSVMLQESRPSRGDPTRGHGTLKQQASFLCPVHKHHGKS